MKTFVKMIKYGKHLRDQGPFDQCPIFKPCVNFQHEKRNEK